MPLYEYRCVSCQAHLEQRQRFDDPPLQHCPTCGGTLVRMIQPIGIIFKGSGFYCTDHRSTKDTAESRDGSTSSSTGSSGAGDTKKETAAAST